jgi:isoquinoline 1-oxidoreductase beta subunit
VQAVHVARALPGQAMQLLWPREEDFTHDVYRPAGAAVLRAVLDGHGQPRALLIHSAGDAITPRWLARNVPGLSGPLDPPDKTAAEGLFDLPYAVPHQRMRHVATRHPVPVGNWRSVGHSHNAFFSEGFLDELAHAAGADPLAYRMGLLADAPRHAAVLRLAGEKAGWGRPLPAGRARGVALHESFGTVVALVLEVSVVQGRPRVHRAVCALDCGTVLHPVGVAQQVEGSIVFGLGAALDGRIDIVGGEVQARNFPQQMPLTLRETPAIETHWVDSTRAPSGTGEPAVPPVAPALANALFALTGRRLRELPLRLAPA